MLLIVLAIADHSHGDTLIRALVPLACVDRTFHAKPARSSLARYMVSGLGRA